MMNGNEEPRRGVAERPGRSPKEDPRTTALRTALDLVSWSQRTIAGEVGVSHVMLTLYKKGTIPAPETMDRIGELLEERAEALLRAGKRVRKLARRDLKRAGKVVNASSSAAASSGTAKEEEEVQPARPEASGRHAQDSDVPPDSGSADADVFSSAPSPEAPSAEIGGELQDFFDVPRPAVFPAQHNRSSQIFADWDGA